MALSHDFGSPSSSHSPLSWVGRFLANSKNEICIIPENKKRGADYLHEKFSHKKICEDTAVHDARREENARCEAKAKGLHGKYAQENCGNLMIGSGAVSLGAGNINKTGSGKLRMRPARLIVPEYSPGLENDLNVLGKKVEDRKEFLIEGRDYYLASKKGRRGEMEDGYGVLIDICGDPKQAFFAVIDGHGGRDAADYVAENLGKNIVKALENCEKQEEQAIRGGYLVTDKDFLSKGVSSGACAASVLFKDGELHVANVGDCRVVLSRKGVAITLTNDHRLSREDERSRIENSGGYVNCRNGVWRVQGSLAISRAIGDLHLKEWVIPEPDIQKLRLAPECEFLIMASDGLWDKVNEQEAVDVVSSDKISIQSCKKLVDVSFSRGNMDDITVMVINLDKFVAQGELLIS